MKQKNLWVMYSQPEPDDAPVLVSARSYRDMLEDCRDFPEGHVYKYDVSGDKYLVNETYLGMARDIRKTARSADDATGKDL